MTEEHKQYEKSIKKKYSFGWTPKYIEETQTRLNKTVIIPLVVMTFEKLAWPVVYQDENTVEAIREKDLWQWGNYISVKYNNEKIEVKSISVGNEMFDLGRNSLRVKLFIKVFQETVQSFDASAIKELEIETEKENNLENYEIPETLEQAKARKIPQVWIPILGAFSIALLLGLFIAFLSLKGVYIFVLFEILVAFAIGYGLKYLIKWSNYTNFKTLNYILIAMVALIYVSNEYFQYQIIINENSYEAISFIEFLKLRLEAGLVLKKINTGWLGLVISWLFQLGFTYVVAVSRLTINLTNYLFKRIPKEVIDFAIYHFVKEKTEHQVRAELSKKGWKEKIDQDEVFEAIDALKDSIDLGRLD